ncbi:hypothetical protein [Niabella drilacis]|uniref:Uncharacterized protein n=1 Tax=Niabella drilacis (strain DSM 25811 / CCM 8410 / CCUG 62505 / LMG 26954 / E90) TaxID=1285928 RepID=A0A1G6TEX2_NIADE|nr:hypothetical protein [Niabella drilacis]SDD27613.1 hypothetical protein SAMN04487894_107192 [Niabella drilacis]
MKHQYIITAVLVFLLQYSAVLPAQDLPPLTSVDSLAYYPKTLTRPNASGIYPNTVIATLLISAPGNYFTDWTITGPNNTANPVGVTLNTTDSYGSATSLRTNSSFVYVVFKSTAAIGTYTVMATRGTTASTTITLTDGSNPSINLWVARDQGDIQRVESFTVSNGKYISGPSTLFYTNTSFAALSSNAYFRQQDGFFYWSNQYDLGANTFDLYSVSSDGGSGNMKVSRWNFPANTPSFAAWNFVRLANDNNTPSSVWTIISDGFQICLAKMPSSGLNQGTTILVDDDVQLSGGTAFDFQGGDLCFDASGNMYVVAGGSDHNYIYTGRPENLKTAATSPSGNTLLTRKWQIYNENNQPFTGSFTGCCFDINGGMYLSVAYNANSAADGIYYLDPATIQNANNTNIIQAKQIYSGSGVTDLASNVFPASTPLAAVFGPVQAVRNKNNITINWDTYSEEHNTYFGVEVSNDGMRFKEVARVKTKAINGNSSSRLSYTCSLTADNEGILISFSLLPVCMILLSFPGRRLLKLLVFLSIIVCSSCSKNKSINSPGDRASIYIRIAQHDLDGSASYSKIVKIIDNN